MQTEHAHRVAIFDDNDLLRDSVAMLMETSSEFFLAGSFADCLDVVRDIKTSQPEVVIMDIDIPGVNGIDAVKILRKEFPSIQVLMQTVFDDDDKVFRALKAGAVGYILKNAPSADLLQSIREVKTGGAPMSPSIARKVMTHFHESLYEALEEDYKLSVRESDVLRLLVQGLSYKMIADRLSITYDTVRAHMKKIYQKLHVASMTEAVAKAINKKMFGFL